MIFRSSAGPRLLLSATPIFREWKARFPQDDVFVETYHPEVLKGNKYVDKAAREILDCREPVMDFDMIQWWEKPRPVVETYLLYAFRDLHMGNWATEMSISEEEMRYAGYVMRQDLGPPHALVGAGISDEVIELVEKAGYLPVEIDEMDNMTLERVAALASLADLYIGHEGDEAAAVLTTKVSAVVLWSWMSPEFFRPFRKGALYEAVRVRETVCEDALFCSQKHIKAELAKVYGVNCQHKRNMWCMGANHTDDIGEAIRRVSNG